MKRTLVTVFLIFFSLLMGFIWGSTAGLMHKPIARTTVSTIVRPFICSNIECGYDNVEDREAVDCSPYTHKNPRIMVLLALGQSNSANHGETLFTPTTAVDNFNTNDGRCYTAKDPLLGATGNKGSPWTRLGDDLVTNGVYDRVLVISIGVGGSKIQRWQPGGDLHPRITRTANALRQAGIHVSHVAWHQGEANSRGSAEDYTSAFGKVVQSLRDNDIDAPVFPAIATICFDQGSDEIRAAQEDLPNQFPGVFMGANTDALDRFAFRHDLCHLSELGLQKHADMWQKIFIDYEQGRR